MPRHALATHEAIDHYILALSWQPAFCQYHPELPECPMVPDPIEPSLTLHGLWPNGTEGQSLFYCHVDAALRVPDDQRRWCEIPAPELSGATQVTIAAIMPGTKSCLERHEWLMHGTCARIDADSYFRIAALLARDVGQSAIGQAIAAAMGGVIETKRLKAEFETAYGKGAGRALSLRCRKDGGRSYLSAIWIRLLPAIRDLDPAIASLDRTLLAIGGARDRGCPPLIYIDAPGF